MPSKISCDIAIVGGGLSGALIALALHARRPDLDVKLIEGTSVIGGDRIWSFSEADVAPEHRWLIAPMIAHMWRGYRIGSSETGAVLDGGYYAISSERLDAHVRATIADRWLVTGRRVAAVTRSSVVLAGGDRIRANGVIDTRGPADLSAFDIDWRKFVGQELVLGSDHDQRCPAIEHLPEPAGGLAFTRSFPLGQGRLFVEANRYDRDARPADAALRAHIADHAAALKLPVEFVAREQQGALPICLGGDFERYWNAGGVQVPKAGARAGLFHPMNGHTLPDAVRVAIMVAGFDRLDAPFLHDALFEHARAVWRERGFYRLYGRLLLRAAEAEGAAAMIDRFYRLDPAIISRFYSAHSTRLDQLKILGGRPAISLRQAFAAFRGKGV